MTKILDVLNKEIVFLESYIRLAIRAVDEADKNNPNKVIQLQMELVAMNTQLNLLKRLKYNLERE